MRLTDEQLTARNRRNRAIAGGLVVFMVLVFIATVLNLRRNIDNAADERAQQQGAVIKPSAVTTSGPAIPPGEPRP